MEQWGDGPVACQMSIFHCKAGCSQLYVEIVECLIVRNPLTANRYIYLHTYVHTYTYLHVYVYVHFYVDIHTYANTHLHFNVNMQLLVSNMEFFHNSQTHENKIKNTY